MKLLIMQTKNRPISLLPLSIFGGGEGTCLPTSFLVAWTISLPKLIIIWSLGIWRVMKSLVFAGLIIPATTLHPRLIKFFALSLYRAFTPLGIAMQPLAV